MQGKEEQALKIVLYDKYYAFSNTYIQTNEFLCYKGFFLFFLQMHVYQIVLGYGKRDNIEESATHMMVCR